MEEIESLCLEFLKHAANPLTPIETLYQVCEEKGQTGMTLNDLVTFLRNHSAVLVVDGPGSQAPVRVEEFAEAGIIMGPRAILKSRIPSKSEMREMMVQQLEHMQEQLLHALKRAEAKQDRKAEKEIEIALQRAKLLEKRIKNLF